MQSRGALFGPIMVLDVDVRYVYFLLDVLSTY